MITIHHLNDSRSERIVWLAEELGLPYKLVRHQREKTGAAPPEYKELHPLGKAPVIEDGGVKLAESGAIVEYLVQRHGDGRLAPKPQDASYRDYLYWMHFAEGSLMMLSMIALVISRIPEAKESPVKQRMDGRLKGMLAFVDAQLASRTWFAGDAFTAADVMMLFPFTTMRHYLDYDIAAYPNIVAYVKRIEARPAYAKAMSIAGRGK